MDLVELAEVVTVGSHRLGEHRALTIFPQPGQRAWHVPQWDAVLLLDGNDHIVLPVASVIRWRCKEMPHDHF